jgi:ribosome modulation factor
MASQMSFMEQGTDSPSATFTEGYESGRTGGPRAENPHAVDSTEAEQWFKGWDEGSAKRDVVSAKPDPDTPANG